MPIGPAPDWTNLTWFIGNYEGTPTLIAVDADGNIVVQMMGMSPTGLQTIAVDANGQLYALIKGSAGEDVAVDVNGFFSVILKGDDSGALRTVAVDSGGNIIAVMKGVYAGTLKSVAVDSEGRMIMIPTDPADIWGNAISMGNAELAAVLSPAKRYDRRGNVIWLDDFESGIGKWDVEDELGAAAGAISTQAARSGAYSMRLDNGTTGAVYDLATRGLAYPILGKMGFEFSWGADNVYYILEVLFNLFDGTNKLDARWKINNQTGALQYYDSAGVWQSIAAGIGVSQTKDVFSTSKLVVDFANKLYVRLLLNNVEYNLSAYGIRETASSVGAKVTLQIKVSPGDSTQCYVYVDDVIVTQNEPANA